MGEYIEREAAIKAVMAAKWEIGSDGAMAMEIVASLPAADVAPVVHGRWVIRDIETISQRGRKIKSRLLICSCCERSNGRAPKAYCPNCGAKMGFK